MPPARPTFDPIAILQKLEEHGVLYIVIGTLARVIHGTGEMTTGLDIVPAMRPPNLRHLRLALRDLDARCLNGEPVDLERDLDASSMLELRTRAGTLKIVPLPAGTRGYTNLRRYARSESLGAGVCPYVASLIDLDVMLWALDRHDEVALVHRVMDIEARRRRKEQRQRQRQRRGA
jgi:hypothetical protein